MNDRVKTAIKINMLSLFILLGTINVTYYSNNKGFITNILFGVSCFNLLSLFISQLFIFKHLEMYNLINDIVFRLNVIPQALILTIAYHQLSLNNAITIVALINCVSTVICLRSIKNMYSNE